MAAKKMVLKMPETGNLSSFAELMGMFGAIPKSVESESTVNELKLSSVDSKSTVAELKLESVELKSTEEKLGLADPKQGSVDTELKLTGVEPKSTDEELRLASVDHESTVVESKLINVELKSTPVEPKPTRVELKPTPVDFGSTHGLPSVDYVPTLDSLSVGLESTTTSMIVESESTGNIFSVELESTGVELKPTPVELESTPNTYSVDQQSTHCQPNVDLESTIKPNIVERKSTRVERQSTHKPLGVESLSTQSIYWYSQNRDFYLIGVWHVLSEILGANMCTVTLRPLANKLGMDASFLHKVLKRLDAAGMIRFIPQKDGSFIEILNPLLIDSPHEEAEDSNNKQLPHKKLKRDFQKEMELREALSAIFWGCMSVDMDVNSLSGTTINYLVELSFKRSSSYVAGIAVKYIKSARHPLSFLQTVFNKEPDPLSKLEIDKGKEVADAGSEILRNIGRIEELGLIGMKTFTKSFPNIDLGRTIENGKVALETLLKNYSEFLDKWQTELD
jgi:hypothetical protein